MLFKIKNLITCYAFFSLVCGLIALICLNTVRADDAGVKNAPGFADAVYGPDTKWTVTPSDAMLKEESINDIDHGKGKSFYIDMSKAASNRFSIRLTGLNTSINDVNWAGAWIKINNREPFYRMNIYVFTPNGCFKKSTQDLGDPEGPWIELGISKALSKSKSYFEGKPKWEETVRAIQISFWKTKNIASVKNWQTTVTIAGFSADKRSGTEKDFTIPKAEQSLRKPVKRNAKGVVLETRPLLSETSVWLNDGIEVVLDKMKRSGYNVFIPCLWRGLGPIYRSENEPTIDYRYKKYFANGKDPIKELIKEAHARGIEVHPWFSVSKNNAGYAPYRPEFKETGTPSNFFDLQNPAFRDFIVKEIVGFVKKYNNIDGLCLDYTRTGGISFSPTAAREYRKKYGKDISELKNNAWMSDLKLNKRLMEWQKDAVSDIVKRVSEGARAIKPDLVITVCGMPQPKPQLSDQGRNEWLWLENKWIDVAYDMDYGAAPSKKLMLARKADPAHAARYAKMLATYSRIPSAKDRRKIAGMMLGSRSGVGYANAVEYSLRKYYGPGGVATYWYENLNEDIIKELRKGPYKENAIPAWDIKY